jgi:hypothetical protein
MTVEIDLIPLGPETTVLKLVHRGPRRPRPAPHHREGQSTDADSFAVLRVPTAE